MRRLLILSSLLLWVPSAYAQSVRYQSQVIGSRGTPLANQNIAVCGQPANTSTTPCSPLTTLATSTGTTSGGANPLTTDLNGNFFFYAAPGTYTIQIYGGAIATPYVQPDVPVGASGAGSFSTITVSGTGTFNGLLNAPGNLTGGSVPLKPASAAGHYFVADNGSDSNDGLSLGSAFLTPQKCIAVAIANGDGICDATGVHGTAYTTPMIVGNCGSTPGVPVVLLVPNHGAWTFHLTGGTQYALEVCDQSSVIGMHSGLGQPFTVQVDATSNVDSVCGSDPSPATSGSYVVMKGFGCSAVASATVANAVLNVQKLNDGSEVSGMSAGSFSTSATKVSWFHQNICCGTRIERINSDGHNLTGVVPCTIGGVGETKSLSGAMFDAMSCVHAGAGQFSIARVQNASDGGLNMGSMYTEFTGSDLTTAAWGLTGSGSVPDVIHDLRIGLDVASSTRYVVDLVGGTKLIAYTVCTGTVSGNGINDHSTGVPTPAIGTNKCIKEYDSTAFQAQTFHNPIYFPELFALSGSGGFDAFYADPTAHRFKANNNNGGAVTVPYLETSDAWTGTESFAGNTVALTADWTCGTGGTVSSCVAATIIGSGGGVPLTFTLPLFARSYTLECDGVVGQATAATANQWNLLTATNGATNVTANYSMATAATASAYGAVTDQASTTTTFQIAPSWTLGGTATKMPFHIWAKIEGASASGTVLSLQLVAPTVGDLVTIYRGTACRIF